MKICQVVPCFPYKEHTEGKEVEQGYHIGGVEKHALELSNALTKRGHSITILTTKSPAHDIYHEIDGINVVRIPYGIPLYSSSIPLHILWRLNQCDYDLIHAHTPNPMIADLACLKKKDIPFLLTYHNDITKNGVTGKIISYIYNNTLGNFLFNNSDLIVTTTNGYVEKSKYLEKFKLKIRVVPNGTDLNRFNKHVDGTLIKLRYSIPLKSKIVLFVGTLEEYKGVEYLLKAFKKVLIFNKAAYLIIVGSGKLSQKLQRLSQKFEISEKAIFSGYVRDDELPYFYSTSDLFVLPSISEKEGFGIVQLEAMASCKPVICTNLPGVSGVDENEIASIHVPPKDSEALANAIIKLLDDEKLAKKMGENGAKLVEEKYSWEKIAEMTEKIYSEILS